MTRCVKYQEKQITLADYKIEKQKSTFESTIPRSWGGLRPYKDLLRLQTKYDYPFKSLMA